MTPKSETPTSVTDGVKPINTTAEEALDAASGATVEAPTPTPGEEIPAAKQTVTTPTGEAVPMAFVKVVGLEEIERLFTYKQPAPAQLAVLERNRMAIKEVARNMITMIPPSRERGLAITKLEEALFWANAALIRGS